MAYRDEWDEAKAGTGWLGTSSGIGALRLALLFGCGAVVMTLILTPIAENQADRMAFSANPGLDMMATGTVGGQQAAGFGRRDAGSYVVRRSVLQPSPSSVCIIRDNGMRTGDC